MSEINYVTGDATAPMGEGNKIIVHVCNDIGGWGRGFVLALSKKWPEPEQKYREWYRSQKDFELGQILLVQVEESTWVANLIGQRDVKWDAEGNPPVRYDAIRQGMQRLAIKAKKLNASIHMPRIGCGLAGGDWSNISPILEEELKMNHIETTVYDLPE